MSDLIDRQAAIDALDKIFDSIPIEQTTEILTFRRALRDLPSAQPETHDKRTETHACDCINREVAIDALKEHRSIFCDSTPETFSVLPYGDKCRVDEIDNAIATLINLPSAQPDTDESVYKMWKRAYEAGQRNAQPEIIRCKDCKHWREHKYTPFCGFNAIYTKAEDFCSRAERRKS